MLWGLPQWHVRSWLVGLPSTMSKMETMDVENDGQTAWRAVNCLACLACAWRAVHAHAMGRPWARTRNRSPSWSPDLPFYLRFLGADDGIRTRDPHLGKVMRIVRTVLAGPLTRA